MWLGVCNAHKFLHSARQFKIVSIILLACFALGEDLRRRRLAPVISGKREGNQPQHPELEKKLQQWIEDQRMDNK